MRNFSDFFQCRRLFLNQNAASPCSNSGNSDKRVTVAIWRLMTISFRRSMNEAGSSFTLKLVFHRCNWYESEEVVGSHVGTSQTGAVGASVIRGLVLPFLTNLLSRVAYGCLPSYQEYPVWISPIHTSVPLSSDCKSRQIDDKCFDGWISILRFCHDCFAFAVKFLVLVSDLNSILLRYYSVIPKQRLSVTQRESKHWTLESNWPMLLLGRFEY